MNEYPSLGNNHAHLGCCGYDELGYKPPTTTPFSLSRRKPPVKNLQGDPNFVRRVMMNGSRPSVSVSYPVGNLRIW